MSGRPALCRPATWVRVCALFWLALPGVVAAGDDPHAWLERMGEAVEHLNYEGKLVHMYGGDSTVLTITHRFENGHVTERVMSADAGREIIRTDDEVTCIFPDQRTVLVESRDDLTDAESPLRGHLPGPAGINAAYYHVAFSERERILGRDAQGILIRPKDGFRYGYRIWLDRATAMPLITQLVDETGTVLEQVRFTEITLPSRIPDSAVRPSTLIESFAVRRSVSTPEEKSGRVAQEWAAGEVPPGFKLSTRQARGAGKANRGLRHLVYSDGLATVSLFIEPAVAASEQAEGLSQIGAAYAYTAIVEGHMVTAVGEVPVRTVEVLAQSARRVVPPAAGP